MYFAEILLWLFVINLGIVFGAGLYEARIVVPMWASSPPESLQSTDTDSGRKFWPFATTIPLTLLSLANIATAWSAHGVRQEWWLAAVIIILIERILTFSYFIPTIIRLQRGSMPQAMIKAGLARWARLNYLRSALTLLAWLASLMVLSLPA